MAMAMSLAIDSAGRMLLAGDRAVDGVLRLTPAGAHAAKLFGRDLRICTAAPFTGSTTMTSGR